MSAEDEGAPPTTASATSTPDLGASGGGGSSGSGSGSDESPETSPGLDSYSPGD